MIRIVAEHILSPIGENVEENWKAVLEGKKAIRQLEDSSLWPEPFWGAAFSDEQWRALRQPFNPRYSRLETLIIHSISAAADQSGVDLKSADTQIILATTKGNIDQLANEVSNPAQSLLHELANTIGSHFGVQRRPQIVSNACTSGLLAIILAARMLEAGRAKNIVVCGADLLTKFTLSGFQSFKAVDHNPCRPFDAARGGISLGEASASVVLTHSNDTAFPIYQSGASTNDANHISGPSRTGEGLLLAVHRTLKNTEQKPNMISAHGTATPYNDEMECQAFNRAELYDVPLHSLKGIYGHTLGAAGVLETILALQGMKHNQTIASVGYQNHGVTLPLNVSTDSQHHTINSVLKTSSGFGGCNAAALFRK